jgi:hypothetical protein
MCKNYAEKGGMQQWKNWEGKRVWTVSAKDVDYVTFKHWPKPPRNTMAVFKLAPKQITNTTINIP